MKKLNNWPIFTKYWWFKLRYDISIQFRPRQKWLTDTIPKSFCDIDYLIADLTFECLINFWENDDGEASLRYSYEVYDDLVRDQIRSLDDTIEERAHHKHIYDTMKKAYDWAKIRNDIENYARVLDVYEKDTEHLLNIIKYRQYLWT